MHLGSTPAPVLHIAPSCAPPISQVPFFTLRAGSHRQIYVPLPEGEGAGLWGGIHYELPRAVSFKLVSTSKEHVGLHLDFKWVGREGQGQACSWALAGTAWQALGRVPALTAHHRPNALQVLQGP